MVCEAMGVGVEIFFGVEMLLDRGLNPTSLIALARDATLSIKPLD
jgi:hypothetical protein